MKRRGRVEEHFRMCASQEMLFMSPSSTLLLSFFSVRFLINPFAWVTQPLNLKCVITFTTLLASQTELHKQSSEVWEGKRREIYWFPKFALKIKLVALHQGDVLRVWADGGALQVESS
jgi:hypothetical protein